MATDKQDLSLLLTDYFTLLNNGVADDSITPDAHRDLLENTLSTLAFFGVTKFNVIPSGVPSAGQISLDGSNFLTASKIFIHKVNAHSMNVEKALSTIAGGSVIHLKDYNNNFGEFTVNGIVEEATYFSLTVTPNTSNAAYVPTSLEGYLGIMAKGDSANIMNADLTASGNRLQNLDGYNMEFFKGVIVLDGVKIVIKSLEVTTINANVLEIDLIGQVDARTVDVNDDFTLNFVNMQIGSGWINLNITNGGNHTLTSGSNVVWPEQVEQELTPTDGAKDRLYWTCDGIDVECIISKNRG